MRHAWLVAVLVLRCSGYELTGRIEPPAAVPVFLHGATAPFESSTVSGEDGRFRFRKLPAGTYTLALSTAARGEARQTIELSPGTVDSKGRLDIVLRIDDSRLESDGVRTNGATVSATVLSIPDRAMREYKEAQRCLSRSESDVAHPPICGARLRLRRDSQPHGINWVRLRIRRADTAMRRRTSVQRSMPIPKPSSRSSIWAACC